MADEIMGARIAERAPPEGPRFRSPTPRELKLYGFAIRGAVLSLAVVAATALVLEHAAIPNLEAARDLAGLAWHEENQRWHENLSVRNEAGPDDSVWRSAGFPVPVESVKERRILVVGDSFVWGAGHRNVNDLWWRQLEDALMRRGFAEVEVIAAGLEGGSTADQLEAARTVVPRYDPDLIIWGYVTNDPDEGLVRHYSARQGVETRGLFASVFPNLDHVLGSRRADKLEAQRSGTVFGYAYREWEEMILEGRNFAAYSRTVLDLARFLDQVGRPSFVLTLPNRPSEEYFAHRHRPVRRLFERAGLRFVDALPGFVRRYGHTSADDLAWRANPADGHPNAIANRVFAERAADVLTEDYAPYVGPRTAPALPIPTVNDWLPADLAPMVRGSHVHLGMPDRSALMPVMDLGEPHVQLHLARITDVVRVEASGVREVHAIMGAPGEPESIVALERSGDGWRVGGPLRSVLLTADPATSVSLEIVS